MTFVDLALVFLFLLVALNYRVHRSVLYPPFIFSGLWFVDLTIFRTGLIELNPLHGNTLAIVASGALFFSAGGFLASMVPQTLLRMHLFPREQKRTGHFLPDALLILLLCGLPLMLYEVLQLSNSIRSRDLFLAQARQVIVEASQSGQQSAPMLLLSYFVMAATYTALLFAIDRKDWRVWVVNSIAIIACILSTGRTELLFLISGLSAIRLLRRKKESLSSAIWLLRWPVIIFVSLWIGLEFTNKSSDGANSGAANVATHYALIYVSGPLAAFDSVVQHPAEFTGSASHTFSYPWKLAAALHLAPRKELATFDTFVPVPFPINVYTVFKYDFLELGITGTLALFLFLGLLHSLLYLKSKEGGRFSAYLFATSMYAVLMVTFDDEYFLTGLNPHAIAFGLLYFFISSVQLRLFSNRERAPMLASAG